MYSKRFLQALAVFAVLAMLVSACAQPATPAPAQAEPTAAPEPVAKKLVIAGVVFQSDTFMQTVQAGMQAAADAAGAEILLGNTENKLDKEASMIDDYITRGVNAIVITPISADGSLAALKKAKDAGITIICFNTCVSEPGIASAFLVTKNDDLGDKSGAAAVKFITAKLGGKAKVGLLNCDQFEGCPPRKAGFLAQLKTLPGVEVVADQAGWLADKAQPVSEAMLQANPDINVLWAANEGGTVAHAAAVKTLGLGGKVFVFGTDMNNQMGQMLQSADDILQGVTGQAPYQMGFDSLQAALEVLGGKTVEQNVNTPTIFFGRGMDALIKQYIDSEGKAIFEVPAEAPESAAPVAKKLVIAGVVFQSDTFMQTVQAGMQAAADAAGAEILLGNTENKLDKEASMIDDYITRGVNAIVITPISADGSLTAVKKAKDAGITIVCFNTCVSEPGIASAFLVTKNDDLGDKSGAAAVKFITAKLGGKAKVGLLNCDQFEGCPPRKAGFLAQLKTLPGVEVVADQAGWLADKAQPVSEAMLQANPGINVLWAANEGGTVAHAAAVKTLGLGGQVYVFGTDMNNQMGQMLQSADDILQGVTGQAPYQMGYDSLQAALDVLGGKTVEQNVNTPTIFFGRGMDDLIKQYIDSEGKAIFEVPAAESSAPAKKLVIAGVVFQSDTFMQTVQAGMQAAADVAGAEILLGNTENKLDKEASMIDDYITRGVDAIVITPISADGSLTAVKKAKDAGITIVCFNTCVSEPGIASAFLVTKNDDLGDKSGAAAVKFITAKLGGKAKVGLLNCDQFEGCPPRKAGFLAQLKTLPGVEVVADQAGWLADKAQPVSEAMLQANPGINVLWAANEGGTVAHAAAVKTLGLKGQVYVFGTDMNNQMGQMLQSADDILQGVTGQAPYQMGYDAFNAAVDVLGGKTVEQNVTTPTIFFGRGMDDLIKKYIDSEGKAIF